MNHQQIIGHQRFTWLVLCLFSAIVNFAQGVAPEYSLPAGFYSGTRSLSLSAPLGYQVHYTLDGDSVTALSPLYTTPLSLSQTTVVRARCYSEQGQAAVGDMRTQTFLFNENTQFPVISISIRPKDLWSNSEGIFVKGPQIDTCNFYPYPCANFWLGWEKRAYFEYFNPQKQLEQTRDIALEVTGGWSKANDKKGLLLHFDYDDWGFEKVKNWPLMPDKPQLTNWNKLHLRTGGNGENSLFGHDAWLQRAMRHTHNGYIAYRPALLFINGTYWGVYEMRERQDKHFVRYNYEVDKDSIDLIRFPGGGYYQAPVREVQAGSDSAWLRTLYLLRSMHPQTEGYFDLLQAQLDLPNYMDYFAWQTFIGNNDWLGPWMNNIRIWRHQHPQGKWQYLLWDLDGSMGEQWDQRYTPCLDNIKYAREPDYWLNEHSDLFNRACLNPEFRRRFTERYIELLNTTFRKDSLVRYAQQVRSELQAELPRDYTRWYRNFDQWQQNHAGTLSWMEQRWRCVPAMLRQNLGLQHIGIVTLRSDPPLAGIFNVGQLRDLSSGNQVVVSTDFGTPEFEVKPQHGWQFSHWEVDGVRFSEQPRVAFAPNRSEELTAVMIAEPNDFALESWGQVYPNPNTGRLYVQSEAAIGTALLFDVSGHLVRRFSSTTGAAVFDVSDLPDGMYFFRAQAWPRPLKVVIAKQ
jgi:CotH kinase protein/Chitobiase/beta-hexosaminidase C-terminal domain/Secretion system C-terminal sorting domain